MKSKLLIVCLLLFAFFSKGKQIQLAPGMLPKKLHSVQLSCIKGEPAHCKILFTKTVKCKVYGKRNRKKRGIGGSSLTLNAGCSVAIFIIGTLYNLPYTKNTRSSAFFSQFKRGPPSLG